MDQSAYADAEERSAVRAAGRLRNQLLHLVEHPYAAGIAAVLVSGMKQEGLPFSLEKFGRALKVGAQFLPTLPRSSKGTACWTSTRPGASCTIP